MQDHNQATGAPKLKKEDGLLDFKKSALELHNRIRGFSPWPGGYSNLQGKKIYLRKTRVFEDSIKLNPGHLLIEKNHLLVGTGSGVLEILEYRQKVKNQCLRLIISKDFIKEKGYYFAVR
jgi:methionyl-tRNA formyltransferase